MRPLMKKTPKIHEAISASARPPFEPTVRMMATGAVAANSQPMNPFEAYSRPKSDSILRGAGGPSVGRSMCASIFGYLAAISCSSAISASGAVTFGEWLASISW